MIGDHKESLSWNLTRTLENWRSALKFGGIIQVDESYMYQVFNHQSPHHPDNYGEITEFANQFACTWAFNPKDRVFYFIPNELCGRKKD